MFVNTKCKVFNCANYKVICRQLHFNINMLDGKVNIMKSNVNEFQVYALL